MRYKDQVNMMFHKHYWMTLRVFLIIGVTLIVCAGGGYVLDVFFGSQPKFLIIGTLLAFFLGHGLTFVVFRNLTR